MNNVTRGHFGKGRSPVDSSNTPTGGDGGGNDMVERVARLESDVEYIKRDVAEIKNDIKALRQEIQSDFKSVSSDFRAEFKSMSEEFKLIRAEMRTDFRQIFGAIIAVTLGLAGLMAKGFGWL